MLRCILEQLWMRAISDATNHPPINLGLLVTHCKSFAFSRAQQFFLNTVKGSLFVYSAYCEQLISKHSGVARVNKGSHSFYLPPTGLSTSGMNHACQFLTHFTQLVITSSCISCA